MSAQTYLRLSRDLWLLLLSRPMYTKFSALSQIRKESQRSSTSKSLIL